MRRSIAARTVQAAGMLRPHLIRDAYAQPCPATLTRRLLRDAYASTCSTLRTSGT